MFQNDLNQVLWSSLNVFASLAIKERVIDLSMFQWFIIIIIIQEIGAVFRQSGISKIILNFFQISFSLRPQNYAYLQDSRV